MESAKETAAEFMELMNLQNFQGKADTSMYAQQQLHEH